MGGSSSQVVGYKYYAGLMVVIGNTIEKVLNINPDNRGWIFTRPEEIELLKTGDTSITVNKPNLFGGDKGEGGWVGSIDIHTGKPENLRQNAYLALKDSPIVSAYPNLSYLVYRGDSGDKGFHLVSMSGMLKEVLYWVKRIHVKNNGELQWHDSKAEIGTYEWQNDGNLVYGNINFNESSLIQAPSGSYPDSSSGIWNTNTDLSLFPVIASGDVGEGGECKVTKDFNSSGKGFASIEFIYTHLKNAVPGFLPKGLFNVNKEIYLDSPDNITISYKITALFKLSVGFTLYAQVSANEDFDATIAFEGIRLFNVVDKAEIKGEDGSDINPVHKIREILTDDTAMNKPETDVNNDNFILAANRIWDEGLGISWAIQEKSCKEAIDELLFHIEAGIRVNRQTGKYEIVLFRDDLLDLDNAMSFDESNIQDLDMEIATTDDLINALNVSYYDRSNIKDSSFSVYENGNIRTLDQEIAESVNFPYFMSRRNAEKVANWKLKQLSTPTWKGSFTTGVYNARKLNRYDVIKLSWDNLGIVDLPVRVMKISLGDGIDNTVSIDFVEVIPYSSIDYQPVSVDPPTSTILPPQPNSSIAFEMPYYEAVQNFGQTQVDAELSNNPDLGYVAVASKKPQNNSLNALLYTDFGTGYTQQSIVNYCPNAQLDQAIGYLDTSFAIKNIDSLSVVTVGSVFICGSEIMVYESFDINTSIITVKRGALDTVPAQHPIDTVIWFYDEYPNYDTTQYVDGEIVNAKVLTTTPSGVYDLGSATVLPLEINARPIRPYPPANVKIDDVYYKETLDSNQHVFTLSWVHRNRLVQTGGNILGYFDSGVTLESGVTYIVELFEVDEVGVETQILNVNVGNVSSYDVDITGSVSKLFKIQLTSIRDGYRSFQSFTHVIRTFDKTVKFIFDESEIYNPPAANAVNFIL